MKKSLGNKMSDTLLVLLVIPIILVLIISFLLLTENVVLNLSKDKMSIRSQRYADDMITWSEEIVSQLNIYQMILEHEGALNEHSIEILSASYGSYDGYPFGLYWGDENGNFIDVSGWDPGPEYDPTKRSWFSEGLSHTDSFEFGDPYLDMQTGKTVVTASVKVGCTEVETVMAADVYFDYLTALVEDISRYEIDRAFLVTDKSRLILADSDWNMTGKIIDDTMEFELYRNIGNLLDSGFTGMTKAEGDGSYYVNICRVDSLNSLFVTLLFMGWGNKTW